MAINNPTYKKRHFSVWCRLPHVSESVIISNLKMQLNADVIIIRTKVHVCFGRLFYDHMTKLDASILNICHSYRLSTARLVLRRLEPDRWVRGV